MNFYFSIYICPLCLAIHLIITKLFLNHATLFKLYKYNHVNITKNRSAIHNTKMYMIVPLGFSYEFCVIYSNEIM